MNKQSHVRQSFCTSNRNISPKTTDYEYAVRFKLLSFSVKKLTLHKTFNNFSIKGKYLNQKLFKSFLSTSIQFMKVLFIIFKIFKQARLQKPEIIE